jgi:hypothetical protein
MHPTTRLLIPTGKVRSKLGFFFAAAIGILLSAYLAGTRLPYWRIPYRHSFTRGETLYLLVYLKPSGMPSQIARILVNSRFPDGRFFGKAYTFPRFGQVNVEDFGPPDGPVRIVP